MKTKKILYIQYTNPACYPSLGHSARIFADKSWNVLFFGTGSFGESNLLNFAGHPGIVTKKIAYCPEGWRQKIHYVWFCVLSMMAAFWWRARWIYASDPLSSPAALLLSCLPGMKIIFHEHDTPDPAQSERNGFSIFRRFILWSRRKLAQRAFLSILPDERRREDFARKTGRKGATICVLNCPRLEEVRAVKETRNENKLKVYYHGTISSEYIPLSVLRAIAGLPSDIILTIIGYETIGSSGYVGRLKEEADRLRITERVKILKPMSRHQIWANCYDGDVGLALIPAKSHDFNNMHKTGASNKTYDYLACGLAVLVSDLPEWRRTYVEPKYGLACNPDDPGSIAGALRWFFEHPREMIEMGELGRRKILEDWNYEKQFEPVLSKMT